MKQIKTRILPSTEYLHECFEYNFVTGTLIWKSRPQAHFKCEHDWRVFNTKYAGTSGDCKPNSDYCRVGIAYKSYLVHRIIWKMVYDEEPPIVDHKDRNRLNNRLYNLRDAGQHKNAYNVGLTKRNKSGHKGVCWDKNRNKWMATIRAGGKTYHLGRFDSIDAAISARLKAEEELHGEFRCSEIAS